MLSSCQYRRRSYDGATRAQALLLMAAVVEGAGAYDRNALSLQNDAMKAAIRAAKDNGDLVTKVTTTARCPRAVENSYCTT